MILTFPIYFPYQSHENDICIFFFETPLVKGGGGYRIRRFTCFVRFIILSIKFTKEVRYANVLQVSVSSWLMPEGSLDLFGRPCSVLERKCLHFMWLRYNSKKHLGKKCGGVIFSLQFVCVCVSNYSCEQNSSQTDTPDLDAVFVKRLLSTLARTLLKFMTLGQRSMSQWLKIYFLFIILY